MDMRTWLVILMLPLAGCLGFGDEDGPDTHEDDCPDQGGPDDAMDNGNGGMEAMDNGTENGTGLSLALPALGFQQNKTDNETLPTETADPIAQTNMDPCADDVPPTPNELPVPVLAIFKEDGSAFGANDYILPGAALRFNAQNSSDPDGTIGLASLVVVDTNGTRTINLIQEAGLVDAILVFNHPGPVNATLRVIDDDGDAAQASVMAYVNAQETGTATAEGYDPTGGGCEGPSGGDLPPLVEESFFAKEPFVVSAGARWISVTTSNTDEVVICDPDGNALASGEGAAATDDMALPSSTQYFLALHPGGPNQTMSYDVVIHFEPKAE